MDKKDTPLNPMEALINELEDALGLIIDTTQKTDEGTKCK